jgi:hypothetical protein
MCHICRNTKKIKIKALNFENSEFKFKPHGDVKQIEFSYMSVRVKIDTTTL